MTTNSDHFNLSNWKLTLPVDSSGGTSGTAVEIKSLAGYESPYFYDAPNGAMVFDASVAGATTSGSKYPRSELREMTPSGGLAAWKLSQGGTMTATLTVDKVPTMSNGATGKVVVGQIHGQNDEMIRLYWEHNTVYFHNDLSGPKNTENVFTFKDADGNAPNISLGEKFSYKIDAHGNTLTVDIYADGHDYNSTTTLNAVWQSDTLYFKAGVYLGDNASQGWTGLGQTSFYGLDFGHTSGSGLGGLVSGGPVSPPPPPGNPVAQSDSFSGQQDHVIKGNVLADNGHGADTDPGGLALSTVAATLTTAHGGAVSLAANGAFTYMPAAGYSGADTFTYVLKDTAGLSASGTVDISLSAAAGSGGTGQGISGTSGNDTLNADHKTGTTVYGLGGADNISGHDGNDTLYGGDGNDAINGYWGNDTIIGGAGNDTVAGGQGHDTFIVNPGDNGLVIKDFTASGADSDILVVKGFSALQLAGTTLTQSGSDTLLKMTDGTTVTFHGLKAAALTDANLLADINGTTVGLMHAGSVSTPPPPPAPPVAQADSFSGQQGHAVTGSVLADNGHGADTDPNGFALSVTAAALTTAHGAAVALHADGTFTYTPQAGFSGTDAFTYTLKDTAGLSATGTATFSISAPSAPPPVETGLKVTGTSGNNTLNANHDTGTAVYGLGGNDNISGHDGNDSLYGGDGNDVIHGYWGNDIIDGGAGSDILTGNQGADTFVFTAASVGKGVDTVTDFSVKEGDKLDISDILHGHYDPAANAIADFVRIETVGKNSVLSVDLDGHGTASAWTQVATLTGVTGLTDEQLLVHNGTLLVG